MFWKWSTVLTNKGEVPLKDLDLKIHRIVDEEGKEHPFSLIRELCFEPYYLSCDNNGRPWFLYTTRFSRFFLEPEKKEVYAFELKEGDKISCKEYSTKILRKEKIQIEVEVFKILLREDPVFYIDGNKVKKS